MSYDLMLFHLPEGSDGSLLYREFVARDEQGGNHLDAAARAGVGRIAQILQAWRPGLAEFRSPSSILLTDEDLELQLEVMDGAVSVTIPYFREKADEMIGAVTG